jgi:alginate O-acetyltransferase complex protein AlgI
MLFVCFFPQLLSGPISKARDLLPQIKAVRTFDYNQAVEGLKWLLWGMFIKVVLADRLGLYVSSIYDNYEAYSGISCFVASVFYSFQIYGDFAGYSFMALGVGKLLGFNLINNFNHPYLSISVTDFWRRWHISLSTWLKDYVYIPLGGNRCSKLRNYFNIIVTFLVSGIWHGANWTFIVWGLMHGIFQVIEKAFNMQKCENRHLFIRLPRIIITFLFVNFAWIFFRMADLKSGWALFERIFTVGGSLSIPSGIDAIMQMTPLIIVVVSELLSEFSKRRITLINNGNSVVRWLTYVFLFLYILLFGVLDSSQFIYANF